MKLNYWTKMEGLEQCVKLRANPKKAQAGNFYHPLFYRCRVSNTMHLILALQFARVKTMTQISEAFYFKDLGMQIIDMFLKGQFLTRHFETKLFIHQNIFNFQ